MCYDAQTSPFQKVSRRFALEVGPVTDVAVVVVVVDSREEGPPATAVEEEATPVTRLLSRLTTDPPSSSIRQPWLPHMPLPHRAQLWVRSEVASRLALMTTTGECVATAVTGGALTVVTVVADLTAGVVMTAATADAALTAVTDDTTVAIDDLMIDATAATKGSSLESAAETHGTTAELTATVAIHLYTKRPTNTLSRTDGLKNKKTKGENAASNVTGKSRGRILFGGNYYYFELVKAQHLPK